MCLMLNVQVMNAFYVLAFFMRHDRIQTRKDLIYLRLLQFLFSASLS